jgi:hypothetical protein
MARWLALTVMLLLALTPTADTPRTTFLPRIVRPFEPSLDLDITAATYLGGAGADQAAAVDIAPDGALVVAGALANGYTPPGVTPVELLGGGAGAVIRLDPSGRAARSLTRIGGRVSDLEIAPDGMIVVCGDFGVAALGGDAGALRWHAPLGDTRRCAAGSDGTVAALAGDTAYVFDAAGAPLGAWQPGGSAQSDIAVDGASRSAIVAGYTQKNLAGACGGTLQAPFLRSWSYSGAPRWTNYDWSAQQAAAVGLCADSRGLLAAIGRDGRLYLAGYTDGGNSVFTRDPRDITQPLGPRQIKTDRYNDPYGLRGAKALTWYGRFNPADGALERGQFLLTRLDDGSGNSIAPKAITADSGGQVYLAGEQYYQQEQRAARRVGGQPVGSYEGGEGFLLILAPDWSQRLIWTPFAAPGASAGGSPASGVAVRGGSAAVVITLNPKSGVNRALVTVQALQPAAGGGTDGWVAAFPSR